MISHASICQRERASTNQSRYEKALIENQHVYQ
jgi:hypothetical protein